VRLKSSRLFVHPSLRLFLFFFRPLFLSFQADYTHYTVIFNAFVFCQIFNEFNARSIGDNWKAAFSGLSTNPMFLLVIVISTVVQIIFVQFFGNYTKTAGLSLTHWGISIAIGAGSVPLGVLMRFIPVEEDENTFRGYSFRPAGGMAAASSKESDKVESKV
jgi:magnesium-transporting ATPase (P-type)